MAMDMYEITKIGMHGRRSKEIIIDECSVLSIIRMTKTRNKSLHKKLLKWFKEVNNEVIEKGDKSKYDLGKILEGIEEIGRM